MSIYILFFSLICIFSLLGFKSRVKSNVYYLGGGLIFFFIAFRSNGFDYISYLDIFNVIHSGGKREGVESVEYGFELLTKLSPSYRLLIIITSFLSVFLTLSATYKFSRKYLPLLGLVIFITTLMYQCYMGQIRQGIAIAFVAWGIYYNYKGRTLNSVLFILCGCLFHISAILAFSIFIVPSKTYKIKFYIVVCLLLLVLNTMIMNLFIGIFQFEQIAYVQKLAFYANNEEIRSGITFTVLVRILTLFLVIRLNNNEDKSISYLANIYFLGIIIYLVFSFLPQLGGRGALYFVLFETVLVPYIVCKLRRNTFLYLTGYSLVLALSIYRFISFFSVELNYRSFIPYSLYW